VPYILLLLTAKYTCFVHVPLRKMRTTALHRSMQQCTKLLKLMTVAGDNAGAAGSVAAEVGLSAADVHAGLLPEEKLDMVRCLSRLLHQKLLNIDNGCWSHIGEATCCPSGDSYCNGAFLMQ